MNAEDHTALYDAAATWHYEAGACILPAAADGTKKPGVGRWEQYKTQRPTPDVLTAWPWPDIDGIGMVCGAVSGNIEMLELEAAAADLLPAFIEAVTLADPHIAVVLGTYMERTPTGGYHFLYRVEGSVAGNTKLASRPVLPTPSSPSRRQTLIETRGEGGWTVLAPSAGRTHPTGGAWTILMGEPGKIGLLSVAQRDLLHAVAMSFDEMPPPEPWSATPTLPNGTSQRQGDSDTPGADFAERTGWAEILEPAGWKRIYGRGEVTYWQRPGKDDRTISASTGHMGDWLYVFTTSTEFEADRTYTKFGAHAILNHNGDHSAAASALRKAGYGKKAPAPISATTRHLAAVPSSEENSSVAGATALKPKPTPVPVSMSDEGNALLLTQAITGHVLYSPERKILLDWDGARWRWGTREDDTPLVVAYRQLVHGMETPDEVAAKWQNRSLDWGHCARAMAYVKNDPVIQVKVAALDAAKWELNTPGGVVDLHTLERRPPSPDALHTKITAFQPDYETVPERFLHFLAQTFQNAEEPALMIEFIQRLAGHSVLGEVRFHILPFLYGTGANGKGVLAEILLSVLGDYAGAAPSDLLLVGGKDVNAIKADLAGMRLVVCSEVSPTARFHEERVKSLTGGDPVEGRRLYENFIEFQPTHSIWMMGNHEPGIAMGGDAIFRRLRKINFGYTVPDDEQVPSLAAEIVAEEGPAILGWMLRGIPMQMAGLGEPAEVMAATATYATEEDHLARFMEERLDIGGGNLNRQPKQVIVQAYLHWCDLNGEKPIKTAMLGRELKRRGLGEAKSNGREFYSNVNLKVRIPKITDEDVPEQQRFE